MGLKPALRRAELIERKQKKKMEIVATKPMKYIFIIIIKKLCAIQDYQSTEELHYVQASLL